MKNNNITLLDPHQIITNQYDPEHDAQRVILVGGDGRQIADSIKEALKDLKIESTSPVITTPQMDVEYVQVPVIVKETEFKTIEKPIIIPEIRIVEIDKPIVVTEYKTIEVPIIVTELETIIERIEVPVIVKEYKDISKLIYIALSVQVLLTLIGLFAHK